MGAGPIYTQLTHPAQQQQQQQQQYQQMFDAAAMAPIPGLTAPYGNTAAIPGLLPGGPPPPQQIPSPPMPMSNFMASGPYGRQAMQMAGLLANPSQGYPSGLLGGKRPFVPGGK